MPIAPAVRTPVALFVFRRPGPTERLMERLATVRPRRLLIVADGPRSDRAGEAELCEVTRRIAEGVTWPCEVERCYAARNLGCRARLATGLEWVFERTDEAIILEDDCLPDPTFFAFCDELLARYRDDPRVHMVTGTSALAIAGVVVEDSYYFSRGHNTWGWATWARAFRHYDVDMAEWPRVRDERFLERYLPERWMADAATSIMEATYTGEIRTWDFQWAFAGWLSDALCATPRTNLITNVGFDGDAAHGADPGHPLSNQETTPLAFPLVHPRRVAVDEAVEAAAWAVTIPRPAPVPPPRSIVERLLRRAGHRLIGLRAR